MRRRLLQILLFLLLLFALDRGTAALLLRGLERYFGLGSPAEVLLVGHSHMMQGIDAARLQTGLHRPVAKYCREGVTLDDRRAMIEHFLHTHPHGNPDWVVLAVDPFMPGIEVLGRNSYKLFYPFLDDPAMRDHVRKQSSRSDFLLHLAVHTARYDDEMLNRALHGLLGLHRNHRTGTIPDDLLPQGIYTTVPAPQPMQTLRETVRSLTARGMRVLLLNLPVYRCYRDSAPAAFDANNALFADMAHAEPGVYYLDYNPLYSHRRELFYDLIHLNAHGQQIITDRLARDLAELMRHRDR